MGKDNQELLARRRQRRLAWSSLVVPWEASDAALDVFVHAMVVRNLDAVSRVKSEVTDPILNPDPNR